VKRYLLILMLFALSVITYLDRSCMSAAKESIASSMALSDSAMGVVFGAFALGYALAQIPAGWVADRIGPRTALGTVVVAWSALTALTGAAWSFSSLVLIRCLFGFAEAGAFPASARAIFNWLPVHERGRANGIMFSGSRLGAAFAFPLLLWSIDRWGWRKSFLLLSGIGLAWAAVWVVWSRDYDKRNSLADDDVSGPQVNLRQVIRSPAMLMAMAQYFASNFTFFISLSWMFPYLREHYALTRYEAATLAMLPLIVGASAQWVSGFMVDFLYRSGLRTWSRRLPAVFGFALASAGIFTVTYAHTASVAALWFCIATFGTEMTISPSWAFCIDIGGTASGAVSASMNMLGNLGAFVSANAFPFLEHWTGNSNAYFQLAAALNAAAIICWFRMRSEARQQQVTQ
jgi:MFS transporter, ACS family, glucarate transporter